MQRINNNIQSDRSSTWQERLSRLMSRPERKAQIEAENQQADAMTDHVQNLMMGDLFLRR